MSARARCVSCRWPLTEGARFCAHCGSAVPSAWHAAAAAMPTVTPAQASGPRRRTTGPEGRVTDLYARSRPQGRRRWGWGWALLALLAAGGGVWFYALR